MPFKQRRSRLHSSVRIVSSDEAGVWGNKKRFYITYKGETKTARQLSKKIGMNYGTLIGRVHAGWSAREIINTPVRSANYDRHGKRIIHEEPRKSSYHCVPRKIPKEAHPIIKAILLAMREQWMTYAQMQKRSGVSYSALQKHKHGHMGLFSNVEAMANVVGLKIVATKKK